MRLSKERILRLCDNDNDFASYVYERLFYAEHLSLKTQEVIVLLMRNSYLKGQMVGREEIMGQ